MMRRLRLPRRRARAGFDGERGRTGQHRRTFAALDERDARAGAKRDRARRARAAPRDRARSRRARSTAAIDAESSSSTTRCWLTPAGDSRAPARISASASAARHSRIRLAVIGSLAILPPPSGVCRADLPEEQAGDRTDGEAPAEQMDGDDRRDRQQRQQAQRRREDHAASSTPAAASPRATSRTGVPATTCAKRRADAAGGRRQTQPQTAEPRAIVANRRVVDHEIELAAAFDVDQPAAAFDGRLRFLAQRELHDRQPARCRAPAARRARRRRAETENR